MNDPDRIAELEAELAEVIADLKHKQRVNEDLKAENERLKQVCNCDLSNSAGVTIAGGRHSCGRIFVGSRVKELEAEVAEMQALFDLQHSRVGEAEKLWQLAHKEPLTKPDLGRLVEWLCLRGDKAILENLRLSEQLGRCVSALKDAREAMRQHDEAPYQCESSKGARGAMNCVDILDDCLTSLSKG